MKHCIIILMSMLCYASISHAQIKKQFKEESASNTTTVVIKDSKEVDDMQLLQDSFAIDDYAVGDIIYISTEAQVLKEETNTEEIVSTPVNKSPKYKNNNRFSPAKSKRAFNKRKKRSNKKSYSFQAPKTKKAKREKWDKRCYTW